MAASIESDHIFVVLVGTRNPLNIGAVARAMLNFGFRRLRVVHPYEAAFRDARSAVGATEVLTNAEEFATVAEAVVDCTLVVGTTAVKQRQLHHPLRILADAAPLIRQEISGVETEARRVALLFGSEKTGLSNEDLSHCHWLLQVPTGAEQPSMNLGQAVAVCLYELVRSETAPRVDQKSGSASAGELERLSAVLMETLHESGYVRALESSEKELAIRRMLRRLTLSSEDATVGLGMLRQILWKLRAGR